MLTAPLNPEKVEKLKMKRKDEKRLGLVTQVAKMLKSESPNRPLNRRQWRLEAKEYIKDPLTYETDRLARKQEKEESEHKGFMSFQAFKALFNSARGAIAGGKDS